MGPIRTSLVKLSRIKSSYSKKYKPKEKLDVSVFGDGAMVPQEVEKLLHEVDERVKCCGGEFYITDLYRSFDQQKKARQEYESGKKKAYVATPGASWHNAARAVDIDINNLNWKNLDKAGWLKKFWEIACPLGLRPIIKEPDMKASEAWHFDMPGKDWSAAYDKLPYGRVAKCAIFDIGKWDENESKTTVENMFIQSQLIRLGHHEIGDIDGFIGLKTSNALKVLGLIRQSTEQIIDNLKRL